jgi:predicted phage-related endonuclease
VLTGEPPEVDGSDATAHVLAVLYPEADKGATVELGLEGAELLETLAEAKADTRAADARAKTASNELRALLGEAYTGTVDGRPAVTLGTQTRKTECKHCGAVDESAPFRVLRPKASKP